MAVLKDFHKVFKEGLEPLGFKRLKGLRRLDEKQKVGDDLLQ